MLRNGVRELLIRAHSVGITDLLVEFPLQPLIPVRAWLFEFLLIIELSLTVLVYATEPPPDGEVLWVNLDGVAIVLPRCADVHPSSLLFFKI